MHAPLSHYLTPGTAQLQPQDGQYKRIHLKRIQRDTICINKSTAPGLQVNYTFKKRAQEPEAIATNSLPKVSRKPFNLDLPVIKTEPLQKGV